MKFKSNIKYILTFIFFIIIVDLLIGFISYNKISKVNTRFFGEINNSINSTCDILILGSSRAKNHYNSSIISDSLKLETYNAGYGGYGLFFNYAVLKEYLRNNNNVKVVILDISPHTMLLGEESYSKLDKFLPFYYKYDSFKEIIELNPEFSKLRLLFNLYIYNSTAYDFLIDGELTNNENNGFQPLDGQLNVDKYIPMQYQESDILDNNKLMYLSKIIDLCDTSDVKLITIISPTYSKFDVNNVIINQIEKIMESNNILFFNYSDDLEFNGKVIYFRDQLHLNKYGTTKYTNKVIKDLMPHIYGNKY